MDWCPDDVPSSRAAWLMHEIGTFLAEDADDATRDATARTALRNGHRDFAAFTASRCLPEEVVGVQVFVARGGRVTHRAWYRRVPSPIGLLVLCSTVCDAGDEVSLVQSTAGCGRVTTSESWPFGLACAEQMTVPARYRLHTAAREKGLDVVPAEQVTRGSAATDRGSRPPDG
jgi:hypothetical protein